MARVSHESGLDSWPAGTALKAAEGSASEHERHLIFQSGWILSSDRFLNDVYDSQGGACL